MSRERSPSAGARWERTGVTRAASRSARAVQRERAKAQAARDEKLKAKVEGWVGDRIRQTLFSTESLLSELTARMEAKENGAIKEYQNLQSSIRTFEDKLRTSIRDQAIPLAMQACRDELVVQRAQIDSEIRSQIELAKANVCEIKAEHEKWGKDFQTFREETDRRIAVLEKSEWREGRDALRNLEAQFAEYMIEEKEKDILTRRLEVLVKDLEGRNWPWRTHMDRGGSPGPDDSGAVRSNSPSSRDPAKHCVEMAGQDAGSWRPWPPRGTFRPVPPASRPSPTTSMHSSRPSSRPSSAGRRRPEGPHDGYGAGGQHLHVVSNSSVSSGVSRTRPSSARERRPEADAYNGSR